MLLRMMADALHKIGHRQKGSTKRTRKDYEDMLEVRARYKSDREAAKAECGGFSVTAETLRREFPKARRVLGRKP